MSEVTGTVEAVSHKFDKLSLKVNDVWYATKKEYAPAFEINKGDEVVFDDGGKKYLNRVRKLTASTTAAPTGGTGSVKRTPGFPVGVDTKDRSIVRQNSLAHAVRLVSEVVGVTPAKTQAEREKQMEFLTALTLDVARMFEGYSSGDDDAAAASAMIEKAKEEAKAEE